MRSSRRRWPRISSVIAISAPSAALLSPAGPFEGAARLPGGWSPAPCPEGPSTSRPRGSRPNPGGVLVARRGEDRRGAVRVREDSVGLQGTEMGHMLPAPCLQLTRCNSPKSRCRLSSGTRCRFLGFQSSVGPLCPNPEGERPRMIHARRRHLGLGPRPHRAPATPPLGEGQAVEMAQRPAGARKLTYIKTQVRDEGVPFDREAFFGASTAHPELDAGRPGRPPRRGTLGGPPAPTHRRGRRNVLLRFLDSCCQSRTDPSSRPATPSKVMATPAKPGGAGASVSRRILPL